MNIPQDFYLGVYEVTQEEWEKVMGKDKNLSALQRRQESGGKRLLGGCQGICQADQ